MTDKLYDNAGELTRRCLDSLLEDDYTFDDEDEIQEDYLHTYQCKTFADGLTDSITAAHGYNGDTDSTEAKVAFILEKCAETAEIISSSYDKTKLDSLVIAAQRNMDFSVTYRYLGNKSKCYEYMNKSLEQYRQSIDDNDPDWSNVLDIAASNYAYFDDMEQSETLLSHGF